MGATEGILRWLHVLAGVIWVGHLYFFNWVNAQFAVTMDADTKRKVVPELMARALYWFRWGAALTWLTGFLLAGLVFYMHKDLMWPGTVTADQYWATPSIVMVLVTWLGFLVYDQIAARVKDNRAMFGVGLLLTAAVLSGMANWAHFSYRAYAIHVGMLFGTTMAFNVWFRIWPAQKRIIAEVKLGNAPDPALVQMAGLRSKHNTYMSVPLLFAMLNAHQTWAATHEPWTFLAVVAGGWWIVFHLYMISKKVKGL